MSRYIPTTISNKVKRLHHFECAWCGEKLTERHHIKEYSNGGEHSVDNLILLCGNCHTQVHRNEISIHELIKRKSTHVKGDRISGGVQFDMAESNVRLAGGTFLRTPILIMSKGNPILSITKSNSQFFLSVSFFDIEGLPVFWMSSNRFWTLSGHTVISNKRKLIILDAHEDVQLQINQEDGYLEVSGYTYAGGLLLLFSKNEMKIGSHTFSSIDTEDGSIAIDLG